jgi:1,4-dihydroxy-2-naphthoate polyprenyltransferase
MSQNRSKPKRTNSKQKSSGRPGSTRSGRPGAPKTKVKPATASDWIAGSRPRTLPLALSPVLVGVGAASVADGPGVWHPWRSALCLIVSLCLQIGVNYANDYSDGVRGTDAYRVGPSRLTGSGKARPRTVLIVALSFFALAAIAGLVLVLITHYWWLLIVGAAAIAAAWFYTGGKRPYGYYGLGELVVFVFFGIVATAGTTYLLSGIVNQEAWIGGVAVGFIACAVLLVNNLRDIDSDRLAKKRTLTVLIGSTATRVIYCIFVLLPFLILAVLALIYPIAWLGMFILLAIIPACIITITAKTARELILVLQLTSFSGLAFAIVLGCAYAF